MYRQKVFQIEDLTRHRKRYPQSDVIYYVAPCLDSVRRIVRDFKDKDEIDYDQYGMVHLAFCGAVPPNLMKELLKSKKLCNKVVSFVEINLDFECFVDNSFITKVKPFNTRLPKERAKDHADYKYIPTPKDKEIKAEKFDLLMGKEIG